MKTETQPTHTPTPWRAIVPAGNFTKYTLVATEAGQPFRHGDEIADVMDEANAAFIVRAVNAHEDFIDACEKVIKVLRLGIAIDSSDLDTMAELLETVVAKAEGKS